MTKRVIVLPTKDFSQFGEIYSFAEWLARTNILSLKIIYQVFQ